MIAASAERLAWLVNQRRDAEQRLGLARERLSAAQREYAAARKAHNAAVLALVEARESAQGRAS